MTSPRQRLADLLADHSAPGPQATQVRGRIDDVVVTVDGIGRIEFPVPPRQAKALQEMAGLAAYGRGEETLTDTRVRNTWEVPRDAVQVEWGEALEQHLDTVRDRLGLAPSCKLRAELHSMLVYEPGQFFVAHQDSEKDDSMVGTLVVRLPTGGTGGALVVEDRGTPRVYRGSKAVPTLVAFYADCVHEVRPVTSGHRITLTYNLLVAGETGAGDGVDGTVVGALAEHLEQHFATPAEGFGPGDGADRPTRLVYLLDHEYTARGLNWSRLKGVDAHRAATLRAAAARAACEVRLALTQINETWEALVDGYGYHDYDADDEDAPNIDEDPDIHDVDDLLDSSVQLAHWIATDGSVEAVDVYVPEDEVCASTRTADLNPYSSEYEGYMGNYGNTVDRWYRRAALVVWPQALDFANRAELEPGVSLDELSERASQDLAGARSDAATVEPHWSSTVGSHASPAFLGKALRAALELDDSDLARMLLTPFPIEVLGAEHASTLSALVARCGESWSAELVKAWLGPTGWRFAPEKLVWLSGLPEFCAELREHGQAGTTVGAIVVEAGWMLLSARLDDALATESPRNRSEKLAQVAAPLEAMLTAAVDSEPALAERIISGLRERDDQVLDALVPVLRAAATRHTAAGAGPLATLAQDVATRLQARLDEPPRDPGDWSIDLPVGCQCDLCQDLATFLGDGSSQRREWPLATPGRRHIHSRIDTAELPVKHSTRRTGRPYTLVLVKQDALFTVEAAAREQDRENLAWLSEAWVTRAG